MNNVNNRSCINFPNILICALSIKLIEGATENSCHYQHHIWSYCFLVNDQRDAQFFSIYLSLFLTLYMF